MDVEGRTFKDGTETVFCIPGSEFLQVRAMLSELSSKSLGRTNYDTQVTNLEQHICTYSFRRSDAPAFNATSCVYPVHNWCIRRCRLAGSKGTALG